MRNLIIKPTKSILSLSDLELDPEILDHVRTLLALNHEELSWGSKALTDRRRQESLLLCGPPGCGKTSIAMSMALQGDWTFFNVTRSSVVSEYAGDSEK